jgi:hypothetical protein
MSDFLAIPARLFRRSLVPMLLGLLALVLLARLTLLANGGALAFPDEDRYLQSRKVVQQLAAGNPEQACLHLANTQGRPVDALLRLPVAALQVAWEQLGGPPTVSPVSLRLPQAMNYLLLLGNTLLLYRLARRWLATPAALLAVQVYAALVSSSLYVRHLLPYDMALGGLLLALGHLTHPQLALRPFRLGFVTGLLSLLVLGIYPGYYFAPMLLGGVLLERLPRQSWRQAILAGALGAAVVVVPLELLTRYGHISYLRTLQSVSGTITQGDFNEGFTFLGQYLWQVEGLTGLGLLLLALPGAWLVARSRNQPKTLGLCTLGLFPVALWLLHAVLVYFAHSFVFYGRIIHFFVPFLVLYAVTALMALPATARRIGLTTLALITLVQFGHFLQQYQPLTYPRDILAAYSMQPTDSLQYLNESAVPHGWDFAPPPLGPAGTARAPRAFTLVNFTYPFWLSTDSCGFVAPPAKDGLLFDKPHFFSFPAYGFEGFNPAERAHLLTCGFRFRLYRLQ